MFDYYGGFKVISTPYMVDRVRARTHHKKRIDKKWLKRYGHKEVPKKNVIIGNGVIYGHPETIALLQRRIASMNMDPTHCA